MYVLYASNFLGIENSYDPGTPAEIPYVRKAYFAIQSFTIAA